jgi:hypothetical protein
LHVGFRNNIFGEGPVIVLDVISTVDEASNPLAPFEFSNVLADLFSFYCLFPSGLPVPSSLSSSLYRYAIYA